MRSEPVLSESTPAFADLRRAADLRLAVRRFQAATQTTVRKYGLTASQYLLLLVLASADPGERLTLGELGTIMTLAPSSLTELVDRAERAGFVKHSVSVDDGRVHYVEATLHGHDSVRRAFHDLQDERMAVAAAALPVMLEQ